MLHSGNIPYPQLQAKFNEGFLIFYFQSKERAYTDS